MGDPGTEDGTAPTGSEAPRETREAATKRPSSPADALNPQRFLLNLRSLFTPSLPSPTPAAAVPAAPPGSGVEPPAPHERTGEPIAVDRAFAFVDITGFTLYCDRHGEHAAIDLLTRFRGITRDVVARRGTRVDKWLGDGVMLVATQPGALVATAAEIVERCSALGLDTHAGVAAGSVLLFEGEDYVGRPVNLAARLCDAAEPGEILASATIDELPDWVEVVGSVVVHVEGVGDVTEVRSLRVSHEVASTMVTDGTPTLVDMTRGDGGAAA